MSDDSSSAPSNSRHWMFAAPEPMFEDKESAALFNAFCNNLYAMDKDTEGQDTEDQDTNMLEPVDKSNTSLTQPLNETAPDSYPYPSPHSLSSTPSVQQPGPIIVPGHSPSSEPPPTSSSPSPMHPPQTVPRQKPVYANPVPMHPSQPVPRQMPIYGRQSSSCSQLPHNVCRTSCQETIRIIQQLLEYHHKHCPHHNPMVRATPNGYAPNARTSSQVNIHGTTYHQHQQVQWVPRPAPSVPGPSSSAPALPRAGSMPTQKVFDFAKPQVPANFVANPGNHARWRIEKDGRRTYLNTSKGKQAQCSGKTGKQLRDAVKTAKAVNAKL